MPRRYKTYWTFWLIYFFCTSTLSLSSTTETYWNTVHAVFLGISTLLSACALINIAGTTYYHHLTNKYADALLIWSQNQDAPDILCAELTRLVLKTYIRNRWLSYIYTWHPLVEYVRDLERSIFLLGIIAPLQLSQTRKNELFRLLELLTNIREVIVGDCIQHEPLSCPSHD